MKSIPLTQGKNTLVDDLDYNELSKFKWYALKSGRRFYAVRTILTQTGQKLIYMHKQIVGTDAGFEIDHINGDGLDNQKANLRAVDHRTNQQNLHIPKTSKYPGVCWEKSRRRWRATIQIDGKLHTIGRFEIEEDAAEAYRISCKGLAGGCI
jgi:hypothetical protein